MFKKIYIIIAFVFGISSLYAQNQVDALRYSQQFYTGNAKFMSMGNSLSVVGADMSALSINPAGIAVFKSSKIEFSPMVLINNTEATFIERTYDQSVNNIGNSTSEYKVGLGLSNFGMVGVVTNENGAWKQISIGFSYNKMNDYRQELVVSGENNNSSYLDYLVYNANSPYGDKYGDRYSKFREQLAEYSSLLLFDDSNNEYYSHIADAAQYGQTQRKTISRTGHGNEYDITIGANYRNFLYLGGSIGIENVKFEQNVKYSEEDYIDVEVENPIGSGNYVQVDPNIMEYTEFLSTKGYGINFKLGLIFQPVKFIRIGGAVHSSTFYSLTDEYKTSMYADFPTADSNGDYADTEYNLFDYRLKTPLRANAGIAFILEPYKIGSFYTIPMTFSLDYEFVDYSKAKMAEKYNEDEGVFDLPNDAIENQLGKSHSIRTGFEFGLGKISFRGGYSVYSSPYKEIKTINDIFIGSRYVWSGGLGLSFDKVYINVAYSRSVDKNTMYMYDATPNFPSDPIGYIPGETTNSYYGFEPEADVKQMKSFINFTIGFKL